ncbi:Scarecrow-like protein 34 [Morella rubra]|uniref:Scarecrow-like protein 34 n=1 Tax=Morella rubra TaxID=262757 RepID=A0A6A1UNE8_9ROSI|nr:Scarecrow-like protein 34 [Morella rubra]
MDPSFAGLPNIIDDIIVDGRPTSPNYNQYPDLLNEYQFNIPSPDLNFFETPFLPPDQYPSNFSPPIAVGSEAEPDALSVAADGLNPPSMNASPGGHSSSDDSEFSETVIKFMSQILMEENLEDKPCMFFDPLGLQVTEKSFYDALGQKYPPSPNQYQPPPYNNGNVESPEDVFSGSSGNNGTGTTSNSASTSTSSDPLWMGDVEDSKSSFPQSKLSGDSMFQLNLESDGGSKFLANPSNGVPNYMGGGIELLAQNIFKDSETLMQFRRGSEEARRFLPRGSQLVMDLEKNMALQECKGQDDSAEKGERENSSNGSRGRKNREREDIDREEGRSNKQSAVQSESDEIELSEMFEDALSALCSNTSYMKNKASKAAQANGQPQGANGGKSRGKKQGKKKDTVDLNTLLRRPQVLHVVDFGIQYGFQWPSLIEKLSKRPGGPPKLRITGIELPRPGFRPTQSIDETGRRLAQYCERYNVPFEYHAIVSQNWETIQMEDLRIHRNDFLAVNCMLRFKNLRDETVQETSPRDEVLNLIRRMNPDIFVHSIVNGAYNAPFFVTRFREALYHYSALYDIFDVTVSDEHQLERLMFEREFYGRDAMNVIACEGLERVERPETYKQWQVRTLRAGFRGLPLDQQLVNAFKSGVKELYHKDFVLDEDKHWLLQGWKGRIVCASSCWVPA